VSDELTPNTSAPLFASQPDATQYDASNAVQAPLVPVAPQFSSRREMRQAAEAAKAKSSRISTTAAKANAAQAQAVVPAAPVYSTPKSRKVRLSMKDRALARRLAVAPTVAATAPRRSSSYRPSSTRNNGKQHPVKILFVLLVISGFVGGIALPAAALGAGNGGQQLFETSAHGKQDFKSNTTINVPTVNRNEVSATTVAQLKAAQVAKTERATAVALTTASSPSIGPRAPGDDYPWRTAGNTLSPLNYYYRQCVDFVAWRLNRDAGVTHAPWKWTWQTLTPGGGDASEWKAAWERHGWQTSATPVVGSVAWFVGNHVAYVNSIKGSNVVIEEYNGESSRAYAERTIPIDSVGRFLYPPPA
jgi:surface antigen